MIPKVSVPPTKIKTGAVFRALQSIIRITLVTHGQGVWWSAKDIWTRISVMRMI